MTLQDTLHLCKILYICGTKFCCLLVHNMTLPLLFLQQWPRTVQKVVQPLISQVHSWSIFGTFLEKSQFSEISNLGKSTLQFSFLKAVDFVVSGLRVFGQCVDSWRVSARFRLVSFAARRSWTGLYWCNILGFRSMASQCHATSFRPSQSWNSFDHSGSYPTTSTLYYTTLPYLLPRGGYD